MNVFSYIRVSGKGQVGGEGPDRQRESVYNFCCPKAATILGEFFEAGVSGTVEGMDRPEFSRMVEAIVCRRLNGEHIDGFVVERMDRLARDLMVQEMLLKECRENNIKVFAADRGELIDLASDDGDPTRKLIRQVMGALAEWEKAQTNLKLRKAREAVRRKTGRCEGQKPYGQNAMELLVMKVVDMFVLPEHTMQQVADVLNREGCLTRNGTKWNESSVVKLLKRCGKYQRKDPVAYRLKNLAKRTINTGEQNYGRSISST